MTGISAVCVAIARPYAPCILGQARHDARLSGTADLQFRTIAVMPEPPRHDAKSTANAVGLYGPPGFKSPILRHLSSNYAGVLCLGELLLWAFQDLCAHNAHTRPPSGLTSISFLTRAAARASAIPGIRARIPDHQTASRGAANTGGWPRPRFGPALCHVHQQMTVSRLANTGTPHLTVSAALRLAVQSFVPT
jgi:hypothetical protein